MTTHIFERVVVPATIARTISLEPSGSARVASLETEYFRGARCSSCCGLGERQNFPVSDTFSGSSERGRSPARRSLSRRVAIDLELRAT